MARTCHQWASFSIKNLFFENYFLKAWWQMFFLTNSELFYTYDNPKSKKVYGTFGLDWKKQGCTVPWNRILQSNGVVVWGSSYSAQLGHLGAKSNKVLRHKSRWQLHIPIGYRGWKETEIEKMFEISWESSFNKTTVNTFSPWPGANITLRSVISLSFWKGRSFSKH